MTYLGYLIAPIIAIIVQIMANRHAQKVLEKTYAAQRHESLRNLKLTTFSNMNREVEIANGRLGAVEESLAHPPVQSLDNLLHDAWYTTRDFELLFPDLRKQAELLRTILKNREQRIRALMNGSTPLTENPGNAVRKILDEIATQIRADLGIIE